jgi:hypothetical protein
MAVSKKTSFEALIRRTQVWPKGAQKVALERLLEIEEKYKLRPTKAVGPNS